MELLAAVVILSIIIIPVLTLMTGTSTRTVMQGTQSQHLYFAQEVIERVRFEGLTGTGGCSLSSGCSAALDANLREANYQVILTDHVDWHDFYEAQVVVTAIGFGCSDPRAYCVTLYTAVKKP